MNKKALIILEEDDLAILEKIRQEQSPQQAIEFLEEVIAPKLGKKSRCLEGRQMRMR